MSEYNIGEIILEVNGKCSRFSEEYPKCGRFYKTIQMPLFYHKRRRFPANTGELECVWPKIQCEFLYVDLSIP